MSTLIESPHFSINEINESSAGEKRGGGRPDFWEMVFWWTRKPLIGARSVIAGALRPRDLIPIHTEGADVMNKLFNRIVTSM